MRTLITPAASIRSLCGAAAVRRAVVAAHLAVWVGGGTVFVPHRSVAQSVPLPRVHAESSVVVVPGPHYRAGWLHRFLLGTGYRQAWVKPYEVELLDLERFAGGLTPVCPGGGMQTASLRLAGADGRQYVFRSVDKDPGATILPPNLRNTFADDLLKDQTSADHPASALVVAPLLAAAGVLHAHPSLVVMPDDTTLGTFRERYGGILGVIEERPRDGPDGTAGFAGSTRIEGTDHVWEKIEESADDRVDARAFLTARLMDVLIGDWDRHHDQWRWARFPERDGFVWRPIPRDRDHAFARFDGAVLALARTRMPQFVNFGETIDNIYGLTWTGRALDRRFLAELERPVWDSVATHIQTVLTDDVIDAAVARLPEATDPATSVRLARALKSRRDGLAAAAERFYRLLAAAPDVHATDESDRAEIVRLGDGSVTVSIYRDDASTGETDGEPVYQRTFRRDETDEIRVYLHGGADRALVSGSAAARIRVRVIGGGGDDHLIDRSGAGRLTHFYDARGDNVLEGETAVDRHRFRPPPRTDHLPEKSPGSCGDPTPEWPDRAMADPFPDWGAFWFPTPWLALQPDVGLVVGVGVQRTSYGFRRAPHASRVDLRGGYAGGPDRFYGELIADERDLLVGLDAGLTVRYSGVEIVRFHGIGNETTLSQPDPFYQITRRALTIEPSVTYSTSDVFRVTVGPVFQFADTKTEEDKVIATIAPLGAGTFAEAGLQGTAVLDTRNRVIAPSRGVRLVGRGRVIGSAFDPISTFGSVSGEAAVYLTPDLLNEPTLALRAGGTKVFGDAPFHELAYIGGATTVRGHNDHRFAGDASLFGNAELRVAAARISFGELGVFGLGDVGRVFADGETSNRWHTAAGGGLWIALVNRGATASVAVASGERRLVYAQAGFMF